VSVVAATLERLYGKLCWGVSYYSHVNLSLSFGNPRLRVREPYETHSTSEQLRRLAARRQVTVTGEWWLWVFCAYWRIAQDGERLAGLSSSARQRRRAFDFLDGQKLVTATVKPRTGLTRFGFDLGASLEVTRCVRGSDDELWLLYKPNGYVLTVRGNGTYEHRPGGATESRPRLVPVPGRSDRVRRAATRARRDGRSVRGPD
jgi:hypothetical protein